MVGNSGKECGTMGRYGYTFAEKRQWMEQQKLLRQVAEDNNSSSVYPIIYIEEGIHFAPTILDKEPLQWFDSAEWRHEVLDNMVS